MLTLPSAFATELWADGHNLRLLVEIMATTPIYRCSGGAQIVFTPDGVAAARTYLPDEFSFGEISASVAQENPTLELRLQNVYDPATMAAGRTWSTLIAAEDLNGVVVNFRLVAASILNDGEAQIPEENWRVNRPRIEGDDVVLLLGPPHNVFVEETPRPSLRSPRCESEYKDPVTCASVSAKLTCPGRSLAECMARHSPDAVRISQLPYLDQSLKRRSG